MKNAIYPGSFDPVTVGHLNIIRRAAEIFDHLTVCVMVNAGKNPMFTLEERVELIRRVTKNLPNVEVDASGELLAEYARKKGKCVIVKGLRAGSDFENEFQMAMINHKLNPDLVIMNKIWDVDYIGETRTVDMHVKTLRQKLGADSGNLIKTIRNVGYVME